MPSERLEEGALLEGRYEILEVIGRGGMGTVYRARDSRLDTIVAVKEMAERYQTAEERAAAVRQFEREAKLLGQLHHPNLPRVTDYFVDGDRCYLIMEFVEGEPLDVRLRDTGGLGLPLPDVLFWGLQLADVLVYLHGQDPPVVFRDLKPANIMLLPDNRIKLIDFGIARRFQAGATKDTLLYGSPGYSPPEQYGRTQTDPRSDLYALGATLHHLVTGRDPAPTPFKFGPIRSLNPTLPAALESLISRCLEMDINKRCQTALEVRDELVKIRNAVMPRPAAAKPSQPAPPAARVISARLAAAAGESQSRQIIAIAAALLVLVLVVIAAVYVRKPTIRATSPPPRPQIQEGQPPSFDSGSATGRLKVSSTPSGAKVYLDDREVGATPVEIPNVAAGKHTLRVAPPVDSGFSEVSREVAMAAGTPMDVDLHLPQAAATSSGSAGTPTAELQSINVQPASERGTDGAMHTGLRITSTLRLMGAAGKSGVVSAFFYGTDRVTPLRPRIDATVYQNAEGQLSISRSFEAAGDPADLPDLTLFVPDAVFPVNYDQVTWRLIVFVDNKPIFQTPIRPLTR